MPTLKLEPLNPHWSLPYSEVFFFFLDRVYGVFGPSLHAVNMFEAGAGRHLHVRVPLHLIHLLLILSCLRQHVYIFALI